MDLTLTHTLTLTRILNLNLTLTHPHPHPHLSPSPASKAWTDTPEAERDVAVLFPGQGTQKVGMAGKLLESPAVQGLFELSSKVLGYDMVGLCAQGPQEKLDTTLYSQVGARPSPLTPSTFT